MRQNHRYLMRAILILMLLVIPALGTAKAQTSEKDLIKAVRQGEAATVKRLLADGVSANAKNDEGVTALKGATGRGQTEIVRLLQDRGAVRGTEAVRVQTKESLGGAASLGRTGIVKDLLAQGADVNAKNEHGVVPLIGAAAHGHTKIVKLLLDRGADVNARDDYDSTALITAAGHGHLDILKILIARGANVNAANDYGITALRSAAGQGRIEVVKLLLDRGADPSKKDQAGKTALSAAEERGHTNVAQLLKRAETNLPRERN